MLAAGFNFENTQALFCMTLTRHIYEGWNFNSGNYLFTTDTK